MPVVALQSGKRFEVAPDRSILDAARDQGIILEYSCRTGRCGICKAPVLSGETTVLRSEAESLTAAEAAAGMILTCCRAAASDVALDIEPLDRLAGIEIKTMPARIVSIEQLAPEIVRVVLRTPPASPLRFVAGQYVDILADGVRRSYSLANAPRADGLLEFLIKRYPGGHLSAYWFERAKPNDLVRIEGPFGTFFLRDEAPANLLFLATGTGIAPVKALLEEIAADPAQAARHRLRVFWGNREAENFCWDPVTLGLDVGFHHLLSGNDAGWSGKRGYVHDAASDDGFDPAETMVYACGSNAMIASAREKFLALGLPSRRFLSDAFVSSN
ncbi:FAD-binding oxidoreductase [Sphingomonas hengshuiensis]|uniref:CDP-6-deoxy-L-threo-D-glycero-4-hexulose-3-dehydrase reductase n=1 Tax=Sphingomonas hengshuiensis TaxID=1609977 RepID=A0A7U5BGF7_9SPHN|nr:FAD-binding oxidoreductase [Sphingomonas hengshuiensis]AJP74790.1 CDP-6-deoxy-L-threo-D-glycero-4-hexulose-3-dehydrase reductase [Sphingomonas hengshuiensis]